MMNKFNTSPDSKQLVQATAYVAARVFIHKLLIKHLKQ